MSISISSNSAAMWASNNLASTNSSLQRSLTRLATGTKIMSPSEDSGGLAVGLKQRAATNRQEAANTNIGNGTSFLQTQDGALRLTAKIIDRIGELKTLSGDVTKSSSDQDAYNTEFSYLQEQLTSLSKEKFNNVSLFSASALSVQSTEDGETMISLTGIDLFGGGSPTNTADIANAANLGAVSHDTLTGALEDVADHRATNGALQTRMNYASELLTVNKTNLDAAISRIMDVDVAEESTQLARWNTLTQSGTSVLAQANQSPQLALKLLT